MINSDIIGEFSRLLIDLSIQNAIPINQSRLNMSLEYKFGFMLLNISIDSDEEFCDAISILARKAVQSIIEDNSLDGMGLSIEVI